MLLPSHHQEGEMAILKRQSTEVETMEESREYKEGAALAAELQAKPLSLLQKLAAIRREIKNIEKLGKNEFHKYAYVRAEDVQGIIGDKLAEYNIFMSRENIKIEYSVGQTTRGSIETIARVVCDFVFNDADSEQRLVIASMGEGRDSGDKAGYKCLTGALKYAITQPFMLRIGDDPEDDAHEKRNGGSKIDTSTRQADPADNGNTDFPITTEQANEISTLLKQLIECRGDSARARQTESKFVERYGSILGMSQATAIEAIKELGLRLRAEASYTAKSGAGGH